MLERGAHGHVERLLDVHAPHPHVQHLGLEARAAADLAGHEQVGEKVHLHLHPAGPLTRTSSTSGLKRAPPQTSQGTSRSARKYISTCTQPAPSPARPAPRA